MAESGPVALADMEEDTGISMRRLKNLVKKRPKTVFDEDHQIIGHGPFLLKEGREKIVLGGKEYFSPSPWEALMSVFYLEQSIEWHGFCYRSGDPVMVKVFPEGVDTELETLYISFLHPDELSRDNIDQLSDWCVPLIGDEAAEEYLRKYPNRVAIPLSQAYQFARDAFDASIDLKD